MTKPTGKSGKGRNQRKKPNNGNATVTKYFPTEKKPAQTSNNSRKTTNDASSVASNGSNCSNTSSGSNNSYSGAVKNTNSTTPMNLEEKFVKTLGTTTEDNENWTTVSNKSPPRNTDKQNRESTPARHAKTDTTTTKAARKARSPMSNRDSPKRSNNPNVVTEEKPEKPKPKSLPTKGKKPEDAPKETPNPVGVASPPKLGRNPQQPDAKAALEPETTPLLTPVVATKERRYPKPLQPCLTPIAATQVNRISE